MNALVAMRLLLEDGTEMSGRAFGAAGSVGGEVVFCGRSPHEAVKMCPIGCGRKAKLPRARTTTGKLLPWIELQIPDGHHGTAKRRPHDS